ncbi:MAG: DUF3038 domain-containing protein [Cyanobacteria bacterium J06576_12]
MSVPTLGDNLWAEELSAAQLGSIKAQLDLVLMAVEALTNIGSDAVLSAMKSLTAKNKLAPPNPAR